MLAIKKPLSHLANLRLLGLVVAIAIVGWIAFRVGMYAYAHQLLDKHGRATRSGGQVVKVVLSTKEEVDTVTPYLEYLPSLRQVSVISVPLDDSHLRDIGALRSVHRLQLSGCEITDEDLHYLGALSSVEWLVLSGNPIQGHGLKYLSNLTSLRQLHLGSSRFHGTGIESLAGLPSLHELYVDNTPLTDTGMTSIARLPQLRLISFNGTDVTEDGLMKLVDCLWLMNIGFPSSMVPEIPDIREWRRAKDEMSIRFREARRTAIREARRRGEDAPPESALPFRNVETYAPAQQ